MARTYRARVFFPWERTGGLVRRLGLERIRPFLWALLLGSVVVVIALRERNAAGERRTRAVMSEVRQALDRYLAQHEGQCPRRFSELEPYARFKGVPRDGWGNPLRLICPSPRGDLPYLLYSDGPDGKPGGLDRIE